MKKETTMPTRTTRSATKLLNRLRDTRLTNHERNTAEYSGSLHRTLEEGAHDNTPPDRNAEEQDERQDSCPMIRPENPEQVVATLRAIPSLSRHTLVAQWTTAYGNPPPKGISRRLLEYSAACQIQVKTFGGLTPATKRKLRSDPKPVRKIPASSGRQRKPGVLAPGTRLIREWHGQTYTVSVTENGFRYEGRIYTSLSEIARAITGVRWSGPRFFGR